MIDLVLEFSDHIVGYAIRVIAFISYALIRISLPILSLGRLTVQGYSSQESDFNCYGYKRLPNGKISIHKGLAGVIGFWCWVALIVTWAIIKLRAAR